MQTSWVIGLVTICDKFKYRLVHMSIVPPPPHKFRGLFLVFEIWTKRRARKNCSETGGLVERRGGSTWKEGISKLFHQFSFRKACFHYYWIFLSGKYWSLLGILIDLFFHMIFTRKRYIMKFLFLLLLFLTIILWKFNC